MQDKKKKKIVVDQVASSCPSGYQPELIKDFADSALLHKKSEAMCLST